MDEPSIADPSVIAPTQSPSPVAADRRRPGRVNYTNPTLVDLLRAPPDATAEPAETVEEPEDGLAPARGIVLGVMIGAVMWGMLAASLWFWLSH